MRQREKARENNERSREGIQVRIGIEPYKETIRQRKTERKKREKEKKEKKERKKERKKREKREIIF